MAASPPAPRRRREARVSVVSALCDDPPADALLIRPDGFVAWAGSSSASAGLCRALAAWFGPSRR
jgi:hypothetical protein